MKLQIPAAFKELFEPWRYKVYYGGRAGAKTQTFSTALIVKAASQPLRWLCTREYQSSIKDSVKLALEDAIERSQFWNKFKSTRDEIQTRDGKGVIMFRGAKINPENLKSIPDLDGTWIEEGQSLSRESWDTLKNTVLRKPNSEIWVSMNPRLSDDPLYADFIRDELYKGLALVKLVNYYDNPFFPGALKDEVRIAKAHDYDRFRHIWLGEPLKISDAIVFKGKFEVRNFDTPEGTRFHFGGDWGFSRDPAALVRFWIDEPNRIIYIDWEAYGVGLELSDDPGGLPDIFSKVPGSKDWPIRADNSRPETINFMRKRGFKIVPSKKGKNSVMEGIEFLRGYRIIIHEDRCKNTAYEFANYSFKVDKEDNPLPILIDKDNHCIDALRYGAEILWKPKVIIV